MNTLILKVYFFLATSCPISQQYTSYINEFAKDASNRGIETTIVFPVGKSNVNKDVATFIQKYAITAPYSIDRHFRLAKQWNATVTPEVFVLNSKNEIVYHGAIDNWFYALGQNRIHVTEHYLDDAVYQVLNNMPVTKPFVKPVGCFIETANRGN